MKLRFYLIPALMLCLLVVLGCERQSRNSEPPLNPANMDVSIAPGEDFFQYANGTWVENNPVPDEYSRYGAFEQLIERNNDDIKTLLNEATKKRGQTGSNWQKIGEFITDHWKLVTIVGLAIIGIFVLFAEMSKEPAPDVKVLFISSSYVLPDDTIEKFQNKYKNNKKQDSVNCSPAVDNLKCLCRVPVKKIDQVKVIR